MPEDRHDESSTPDACPAWCARQHMPGDHPEDRLHQSPPRYTVVVASPGSPDPYAAAVTSPMVGRLVQRTDSPEIWVEVVGEEGGVEGAAVRIAVTTGSARRLVTMLDELLAMPPA
jgi:hypothetical protein